MPTPVYRRIQRELRFQSISMEELAEYLDVPFVTIEMLDPIKDRGLLRRAAEFLGIRPSELMRESGDLRIASQEYLNEVWPHYRERLDITQEMAWNSIESSIEYRNGYVGAQEHVLLVLDGLLPPQASQAQQLNTACFFGGM